MKTNWKLALGSIGGALAIHVVLAACSSSGPQSPSLGAGGPRDSGLLDALLGVLEGKDANAATNDGGTTGPSASTCSQWQVNAVDVTQIYEPTPMPAGVEPFAATVVGSASLVWVRQCIQ